MVRTVCKADGCRNYGGLDPNGICPRCRNAQNKYKKANPKDVASFPCGKCGLDCKEGQRSMGCNLCLKWYHTVCVEMSDDTYDALQKVTMTKWFCGENCEQKADEAIEKLGGLEAQMKGLMLLVEENKKEIKFLTEKVTGKVHKEIHQAVNEMRDIEGRKMNLIVYNLPEAEIPKENDNPAWDTPTRKNMDNDNVCQIIENELKVKLGSGKDKKVVNVVRLDRKSVV